MSSETLIIKWGIKFARWLFWLYRKLGLSDFKTAAILFALAILMSLSEVILIIAEYKGYFNLMILNNSIVQMVVNVFSIFACIFGGFYICRLRKIGISSADGVIEAGLDYRGALEKVGKGLDFLGIGASKLTAQKIPFTRAIELLGQNQGKARILLCDPREAAIETLEKRAGAHLGSFKANVKQSFTLLEQLHCRFPDTLEIRLYKTPNNQNLPPFRLMFINEDLCLVSQTVLGADKEGRLLPQIHLNNHPFSGMAPTFYQAFGSLFTQIWENASPITSADFKEISAIDITGNGKYNHA